MPGLAAVLLVACGASSPVVGATRDFAAPRPPATPATPASRPRLEGPELTTLLSHTPDLVIALHPRALAHDPVYGPLLRRASELAAAYAGPTNLKATALAVLERADEVLFCANDRGEEAVVRLAGVPADIEPLEVVDATGERLWRQVTGDGKGGLRELESVSPPGSTLFVAPGLVWVIASGPAVARVRAALVTGDGPRVEPGHEGELAAMALPGDAVPQLRRGELAPLGAGLRGIRVVLTPGTLGLIECSLSYPDAAAAASAEGTALSVTLAFRHRLEAAIAAGKGRGADAGAPRASGALDWLGAAKVERVGASVLIRAPIPKRWLDDLARAEVAAPPP